MKHPLLALCLLLPVPLAAQTLGIDHRPVGCMVAGKYPRLNACFAPTSQVARARLYFRASASGSNWYYVEMKSDSPCHAGVLPRPKRELIGQDVEYYVEASDRGFASARTEEYRSRVVEKAAECDAKLLLPALLDKAAVAVFPTLPAGFAGSSIGLGATAAIVGGGAVAAGAGVAVATNGGETPASTTTTTSPPSTFPPTTTTTTTTTLAGFSPVFKVFKSGVAVDPGTKITGADPLVLTFDMCESVGPFKLTYGVDVDDSSTTAGCRSTITFTTSGAKASGAGRPLSAAVSSRTYDVLMRMDSLAPNNDPQASKRFTVEVSSTTPPPTSGCAVDKQGPEVTLVAPAAGAVYPLGTRYPVRFEALADDSKTGDNGISLVEYKVDYPGPTQAILGPGASTSPYGYSWTQTDVEAWLGTKCSRIATVRAYAVDSCGNSTLSSSVQITVGTTSTSCVPDAVSSTAGAALVSELAVAGGSGQVVVEGSAVFVRHGRSPMTVRGGSGRTRVEATLVAARGGGSWRFDLSALPGMLPESINVVAGDVVQSAGGLLVFRVQGRPGERIVFSFATR